MLSKINCPICDSSDFKIVLKKDMLDETYTIVKCKKCDLVLVNPAPSKDDLNIFYNEQYKVSAFQEKNVLIKAQKILTLLSKSQIPDGAKFFDLGASHGYFLNEVKKYGFEPFGVEPSKIACENAKRDFGIDIENCFFEESTLRQKQNFFHVITMFDVLEHVSDPNSIFIGFRYVLKEGGRVVLTMPNIDSTGFRLFRRHWEWLTPPAHLFYYSPMTITKLLEKHGFEIEHLETNRGDSAGNILFQFFFSARQKLFYSLKYLVGRKKLLRMKRKVAQSMDKSIDSSGKQFSGLSGVLYSITEFFNPLLKGSELKRNKKGHGASILVLAIKKS